MEQFVLIDGNSLLNRAFYAVSPFTTRDGKPTNGIFGFFKLLFKILADVSPRYLAVAFDLPAPTFRHKLFQDYKGTRKGMPDELAVQLPVLKQVLRDMEICIVEQEGFEADDVIGTLSKKFKSVGVRIYTGDRDALQLVAENVSVCFTKRGVSDTELYTSLNFFEKTGLKPFQIVEEKALMGDASDNIPGVRGVGPKTALELLRQYQTAESCFEHLSSLPPALQKKLAGQEEISRLSHTLASIQTDVPLDVELSECEVFLPFPEAAREQFLKLEFRSLLTPPYFTEQSVPSAPPLDRNVSVSIVYSYAAALEALKTQPRFGFSPEEDGVHVAIGPDEFVFPLKRDLLDSGFFYEDLKPLLYALFTSGKTAFVSDLKTTRHKLYELGIPFECPAEDVSLLRYLLDGRRAPGPKDFVKDLSLPDGARAFSLLCAYDEASVRAADTAEIKLYREIELPLASVLFEMEQAGVRVDESKFPEFSEQYKGELKQIEEEIFSLAGETFNVNSPSRLSDILFFKLNLPHGYAKKNARGDYPTDAETLEKLASEHPIVPLILRYRELKKLQSTYIDGILPLVRGGFVHTTYNQTATATGRLSSTNPNLQNIPVRTEEGRNLRKLFLPREGCVLLDADYSQIELRLLAHFSGCKPLIEAYASGRDIHTETAARIFGVPLSGVTRELRTKAKAVNFGVIYGISAFGLAKDLHCSARDAQAFIDKYFETYPEVREYMRQNVQTARDSGFVTTFLGRKRFIPELNSPNRALRAFGERAAMNMPLQGSAADLIKIAMIHVFERLKREGLSSKLVLQVHDELVLDAPLEERERAAQILKEEMEGAVKFSVPLPAEVGVGRDWYEAKP